MNQNGALCVPPSRQSSTFSPGGLFGILGDPIRRFGRQHRAVVRSLAMELKTAITGILLLFQLCYAADKAQDKPPLAYTQTVQKVVQARTQVVGAAKLLKEKCAKTNASCTSSELAYNKAKGAYDGWVTTMKLAIKNAKKKSLHVDDPSYKTVADGAMNESG